MKSIKNHRTAWLSYGMIVLSGALVGCGGDRPPELGFVAGLGAVEMQGEEGFFPIIDGPNFSGRMAFGIDGPTADVDGQGSGLRIGGRLGLTYSQEELSSRRVAGEPFLEIEDFVGLSLVTPQVVLSYRQMLGGDADDGGLFIEPGIGAGPAIGTLSFGSELQFGDDPIATEIDDYETAIGLGVQPFLRLGYDSGSLLIGAEGGYLWTGIDFDHSLGKNVEEWYIGLFLSFKLGG